jgi:hypothetical protein
MTRQDNSGAAMTQARETTLIDETDTHCEFKFQIPCGRIAFEAEEIYGNVRVSQLLLLRLTQFFIHK